MDLALAVLDPTDADLIDFASRVAARTNARLGVLVVQEARVARVRRIKDADRPDHPHENDHNTAILRAVFNATSMLDNRDATVYVCSGPKRHVALASAMSQATADRLIIADAGDDEDEDRKGLVRRLTRSLPAHLLVIDRASVPKAAPTRVVVPQLDGGGRHALCVTAPALLDAGGKLIAVADPDAKPRSARSFDKAKAKAAPGHRSRMTQVTEGAPALATAAANTVEAGDLVIIEVEHPKRLAAATALAKKIRTDHRVSAMGDAPSIIIVRSADAAGETLLARQFQRVRAHLPVLEREDRVNLTKHLESGGRLSIDFAAMLALSAGIAALGLIQGSTAVVVGAMLVAPLMTPLVAAGLALVQGNARVFRNALSAMAGGILGAFAVALVVGVLSPWDDLSAEVISRTAPNLFDLGIAGLSGFAAAYALARPGLVGTLAGVAIAVALVPPLGAIGIATAKGEFALAFGAAILFATNLVAIIIGASATFRFFGLHAAVTDAAVPLWVRFATVALLTGGLVVSIPLIANQMQQADDGVNRPLLLPLAPALRTAIRERIEREPGLMVIQLARGGIEAENRVTVLLSANGPIDAQVIADIEELVRTNRGPEAEVLIFPLMRAN